MYEQLLKEAEEEGVEVISWPLKGNVKGLYYDRVIALNKIFLPQPKKHASWQKSSATTTHLAETFSIRKSRLIENRKKRQKDGRCKDW